MSAETRARAYETGRSRDREATRSPEGPGQAADLPAGSVAESRTCEALRPRWRNRKHVTDWLATLEPHAFPVLGNTAVDRIRGEDVLRVLTPIWTRRLETARRVRQRIRAVLRWCWAHGYVGENVAGEGIDGALPTMPGGVGALPGAPVCRGACCAGAGGSVSREPSRETLPSISSPDGRAIRRSAGRGVDGD